MNSLKNSIVAILLLGVSYGVYQVITTPEMPVNSASDFHAVAVPEVELSGELESDPSSKIGAAPPPSLTANQFNSNNAPRTSGADLDQKIPQLIVGSTERIPEVSDARGGDETSKAQTTGSLAEQKIPAQPNSGSGLALTAAAEAMPKFDAALQSARQFVTAGQLRQALAELSPQVNNWKLQKPEREMLYSWLDSLAGKVIYSMENHLDALPYVVLTTDNLANLSQKWNVPPELIYNVNRDRIPNPFQLTPGTELKKIEGPFRAELDQQTQLLTLFVGNLYAGRFHTVMDATQLPVGTYRITEKVESGHAQGRFMMVTNSPSVSLHAQPAMPGSQGWTFSEPDARDLFNILTVGSELKILR